MVFRSWIKKEIPYIFIKSNKKKAEKVVFFSFFSLYLSLSLSLSLLAFPSFEIFKAFVEEQERKKVKRFELLMTPRVIASLIRSNDGLHHEELRISHFNHLRAYLELTDTLPEATASQNTATAQGLQVLCTIRANCGGNASIRAASEEHLKTKTLTKYSKQGKFQKRFFVPKNLSKTLKTVTQTTRKEEFNLLDTRVLEKEGLSLSFSCMLCPVLAVENPIPTTTKTKNWLNQDDNDKDNNEYFDDNEAYGPDSDGQSDDAALADPAADPGEGPSHRSTPSSSKAPQKRKSVCFVDPTLGRFNIFR